MSTIGALKQKAMGGIKGLPKNPLPKHKPTKQKTKYKWDSGVYSKGQEYKKR